MTGILIMSDLPWKTYHGGAPELTNVYSDAAGHVASFETPEDAAFATHAVNCHADLLAALKAQETLASLQMPGDPETNIIEVRKMRRAAIAKATGEAK